MFLHFGRGKAWERVINLNQVDVDLPSLVDVADHAHGVEAVEEVEDHQNEDGDPDALASFVLVVSEEFHRGSIEVVHEDRDDCGETEAREETRVAGQVQRERSVVPVIETAELFDRGAECDFSERYQEENDGEVKEKVPFLRGADHEIHADDSDTVAEKKRQVHVAVIDEAASGEHPEVFDDEAEEGYECGHREKLRYIVELRLRCEFIFSLPDYFHLKHPLSVSISLLNAMYHFRFCGAME